MGQLRFRHPGRLVHNLSQAHRSYFQHLPITTAVLIGLILHRLTEALGVDLRDSMTETNIREDERTRLPIEDRAPGDTPRLAFSRQSRQLICTKRYP
jgi:hypothetical protein